MQKLYVFEMSHCTPKSDNSLAILDMKINKPHRVAKRWISLGKKY